WECPGVPAQLSCPISPVSVSAGSLFQPVLTQPASLSASPVTSARLSCTLSSGYNVGDFSLSWFQQKPGSQAPHRLTHSTSSGPSGVPGCFSGSISGNKAVLTIMGAQSEDEANYHCGLLLAHPLESLTVEARLVVS
uniref:Ig-like domain-containing protein n=1 Tax=Capra hircus TaxID=9925 RepID=A0A8C2RLB7_CAPHI